MPAPVHKLLATLRQRSLRKLRVIWRRSMHGTMLSRAIEQMRFGWTASHLRCGCHRRAGFLDCCQSAITRSKSIRRLVPPVSSTSVRCHRNPRGQRHHLRFQVRFPSFPWLSLAGDPDLTSARADLSLEPSHHWFIPRQLWTKKRAAEHRHQARWGAYRLLPISRRRSRLRLWLVSPPVTFLGLCLV